MDTIQETFSGYFNNIFGSCDTLTTLLVNKGFFKDVVLYNKKTISENNII